MKVEKSHTSSLTAHLKNLEQKGANSPRRSRRQEIIKLRAKISKTETKEYKDSMEQSVGSLRKSTRQTNPYPN